ncbi:hypothetical protein C5167_037710 [Papaver somniferum]|uniref:Uncharacterized protein n=1 Tax=Papaver somniferum TaxID=3469 RepID=A0A4Y7IBH6_PAPSO|nr:hypothetical protein C5167_037710 [Papaver somniferum]
MIPAIGSAEAEIHGTIAINSFKLDIVIRLELLFFESDATVEDPSWVDDEDISVRLTNDMNS